MNALKQHLFWVFAGIILLAEVVFALTVVSSRFGESEQLKSQVESSKKSLKGKISGAKQDLLANDGAIEAALQHQIAAGRSYLEFLLFVMERDSKLERIVPDPRDGYFDDLAIAERGRCQQKYYRLTSNLRQDIRKAGISLPNDSAIAQAQWRDGVPSYEQLLDAFKVLWLQEACVDAMKAKNGRAPLVSIVNQFGFGKGGAAGMGEKVQYLGSSGEDAQYRRAAFFMDVSMPFANLPAFISQLLGHERIIEMRGYKIRKVDLIGGEDEPSGPQSVGLVRVELALEAVDFDVDIHKITFSGAAFASENDVASWVGQLRQDSTMDPDAKSFLLGKLARRKPVQEKEIFEITLRPFDQFQPGPGGKLANGKQIEIGKGVIVHLGTVFSSQ